MKMGGCPQDLELVKAAFAKHIAPGSYRDPVVQAAVSR
jgi:hypothetical protein